MVNFISISSIFFFLWLNFGLFGQDTTNLDIHSGWRQKKVVISEFNNIDTLTIVPNSLIFKKINSEHPYTISYELSHFKSGFTMDSIFWGDTFLVSYRVFPFNISNKTFHKSIDEKRKADSLFSEPFYRSPTFVQTPEDFFKIEGIQYSGIFSRGVSFGSNQDLVLNSALDLQLKGKVSNDIEIIAALSDNNIPIQPDGNTAQIRDFDKVFIQVKKGEEHKITAGDYEIRNANQSYFARYYRQLQGAKYQLNYNFKEGGNLISENAFAVSKGKFSRNEFIGQEGNQGPYRLTGNQGEVFIIILAGSEEVYVDGRLLTRGVRNDYTIDYNTGELTFTPLFLITKDARIVVEFEYAEENYFRTIIHSSQNYVFKKGNVFFNAFLEQDSKNRPVQLNLDDQDKQLLASEGDNANEAFIDGINIVEYNEEDLLYELKDSLVDGILYDTVFVLSLNPDKAIYDLDFSFVGLGNGNYEPAISSSNGRVYEWQAPINGTLQGSYEPIVKLITPKKNQLYTLGGSFDLNNETTLFSETAFSINDINTFSDLDANDDKGLATTIKIERTSQLREREHLSLTTTANYEFAHRYFNELEPYRPIEFARDWNDLFVDSLADEHLSSASIALNSRQTLKASYRFSSLIKKGFYKGINNSIAFFWRDKNWLFNTKNSYLSTNTILDKTHFFRPEFEVAYAFNGYDRWTIGLTGQQEINRVKLNEISSLDASSFKNNNLGIYIKSPTNALITTRVNFSRRTDHVANDDKFDIATVGNTLNITADLEPIKGQSASWTFTYRKLNVEDTTLINANSENTILNKINYRSNLGKGAFRLNSTYEISRGREKIREFSFQEVATGQGVFAWVDQNDDDIEQQNEFIVSTLKDSANYIRVLSDVNEFVRVDETALIYSLTLSPFNLWKSEEGVKKFLSKWALQANFNSRRKTQKGDGVRPMNPFAIRLNSENVISENTVVRNVLHFNRTDPVYSISYSWTFNQNKVLVTNGINIRQNQKNSIIGRWTINKAISLNPNAIVGIERYSSQFFEEDNFEIIESGAGIKINSFISNQIRITSDFNFSKKNNKKNLGGESNLSFSLMEELKWSKASNLSLIGSFSYVRHQFDGQVNSTKAFNLLQGLQPGNNYLWRIEFEKYLSNNFILNLQYDGRKAGDRAIVHTGQAQIRAVF